MVPVAEPRAQRIKVQQAFMDMPAPWLQDHAADTALTDRASIPGAASSETLPAPAAPEALAQLEDDVVLGFIARGEPEALGILYDRYGRLVFSIALRVTNDPRSAEEVTQDVFQRVWTHAAGFRPSAGTLTGWLVGITRHRAIDAVRTSQAKGRPREVWLDDAPPLQLTDGTPFEEHAALRGEVRAALATLTAEQRQAIELTYYAGMTSGQIATMLAIPLGTVKTRLRLGLVRLRASLLPGEQMEARGDD